jgi:hypothetical protein
MGTYLGQGWTMLLLLLPLLLLPAAVSRTG